MSDGSLENEKSGEKVAKMTAAVPLMASGCSGLQECTESSALFVISTVSLHHYVFLGSQ